jgi:membrane protein DedA with SNARE-associated domain
MPAGLPPLAMVASQHLPGVLHSLEPALDRYGYRAVAAFVLLEDFGIPVPGETILILGAVYAGTGRLNVVLVALIGFIAAVLGDNIGFAIGYLGGRRLIARYGRYMLITTERLEKAAGFFERHGAKVVVAARFIEGLRQANGIIAGVSEMHWARFLTYNAIGAAVWVAVWTGIGYLSGNHLNTIYSAATRYEAYLALAAVAFVMICLAIRLKRAKRVRGQSLSGA